MPGELLFPTSQELLTDSIDLQCAEYQKVCLLLLQLILEHRCHLMAFEDLVGRLTLNKKYHLGAAETGNSMNELTQSTRMVAPFARDLLLCLTLCSIS